MASNSRQEDRILGNLDSADGMGLVRMQDLLNTDIEDVWSAITDPSRLGSWYGEISGDLRAGGEYQARVFFSGWEGSGRVETCERPRRLVVTGAEPDQDHEDVTDITLTSEGDQTMLVLEQRGLPLAYLAAFGAGMQVHIEDLAAHLAGKERCDGVARMDELLPAYEALAGNMDEP